MNENNLIPFTSEQSREEAVKNGRNGGKKSGKIRRKKRDMKACMQLLLDLPASAVGDYELLAELGVMFGELSEEEITNMLVVNAALLKSAKKGDIQAIKELRDIIRDDERIKLERERIRLEKKRLEGGSSASVEVRIIDDI